MGYLIYVLILEFGVILRSSALLTCTEIGHDWAVLWSGVHEFSRVFLFFFFTEKGYLNGFGVILRSSALECSDVGHYGAVLWSGVHEFSQFYVFFVWKKGYWCKVRVIGRSSAFSTIECRTMLGGIGIF
jgi:hypothetical protein